MSGWRPPFPPFLAGIYYGSIFPAVQNLLLGARAAGLGASLTVMPLWSVSLARRVLDLPLWVSPVAVIPIGWPIGRYGPTTRVPVGDAVHFDQYGNRPYRGMTADLEGAQLGGDLPTRRDPNSRSHPPAGTTRAENLAAALRLMATGSLPASVCVTFPGSILPTPRCSRVRMDGPV